VSNGAGGYNAHVTAVFWTANGVSVDDSHFAPDTCVDRPYYNPTPTVFTNQLDAGSSIAVTTNLATGTLTPDTVPFVSITYKTPLAGIAHSPDADITFAIPGATPGIAASTLRAHTPKVLLLDTISNVPPDSLYLSWNAGRLDTTAVIIRLILKPAVGIQPGEVISCGLVDDGSHWVNKKTAAKWAAADPTKKTVQAVRFETTFASAPNNALLIGLAEFDTVKTSFP
jgi:hypothetical protein